MQEYIKADQLIHQLTQVIAKANRTFVPKKPDDSHTNLYYDPLSDKLFGRWIQTGAKKIILALDLVYFQFEIIDNRQNILCQYPVIGKKISELEEEIALGLGQVGLDTSTFTAPLHFEITAYPFRDKPVGVLSVKAHQQWKKFRKLANEASLHLLGYLQSESEIRIWPHHFDTGVYSKVNDKIDIGFGLAMADGMEASPYFYLSGYALGDNKLKLENLPNLETGRWEIGKYWKGAVLPINLLWTLNEIDLTKTVNNFIIGGCKFYLNQ